eukprot:3938265-Rhodomonas_salina.1
MSNGGFCSDVEDPGAVDWYLAGFKEGKSDKKRGRPFNSTKSPVFNVIECEKWLTGHGHQWITGYTDGWMWIQSMM